MKKIIFLIPLFLWIMIGCKPGSDRLRVDLSEIPEKEIKIQRFDIDLFQKHTTDLKTFLELLQPRYPFFLETNLNDPSVVADMQAYLDNPRTWEFQHEVSAKFADVGEIETGLSEIFKHVSYYFPAFRTPRVYAYISGGDYQYPVQFADSVLLIGFDNYLGSSYKAYAADGLSAYQTARMTREYVLPDAVHQLVKGLYPVTIPGNTLLEQMVESGKRLWLAEALAPEIAKNLIIRYTPEHYDWISKNEKHVWTAILTHQMLYSSDGKVMRSFFSDGPFSADFTKESPPRLGEWLGWQIVRAYMENNPDISLNQLLAEKNAQQILSKSGYKP